MVLNTKPQRLSKLAKELNVGITTMVEYLQKKGIDVESNPNTKVPVESYNLLLEAFSDSKQLKEKSKEVSQRMTRQHKDNTVVEPAADKVSKLEAKEEEEELLIEDHSALKVPAPKKRKLKRHPRKRKILRRLKNLQKIPLKKL